MTKMEHYYNYKKRIIYQHERPSTPLPPPPHPTTEEEEDTPSPLSPASSCSSVHSNYGTLEKKKEEVAHPKVARKRSICRSQFRHKKLEIFKLGNSIPTSLCKTKEPYNVCTEKNLQLCCQSQRHSKKVEEYVHKESITASIINSIEGTKRKDFTLRRLLSLENEKNETHNRDSNINVKDNNNLNKPLGNGRHILPAVISRMPIQRRNTISEENKERCDMDERFEQSNIGDKEKETDIPVIGKASPLSINRLKSIKRRRKTISDIRNSKSLIQENETLYHIEGNNRETNKLSPIQKRNLALMKYMPLGDSSSRPFDLSLKNNDLAVPPQPMLENISNPYNDPRLASKNYEQYRSVISNPNNITKKSTQLQPCQESFRNCIVTSSSTVSDTHINKQADPSFPEIKQQIMRMKSLVIQNNQQILPNKECNIQPESTIAGTLVPELRKAICNPPKENQTQQYLRVESKPQRDLHFEKSGNPDITVKKNIQVEHRIEKNLLPDKFAQRVGHNKPAMGSNFRPRIITESPIQSESLVNLPVINNSAAVEDEEVVRSITQLMRSTMEPNFTVEIWLVLNKWYHDLQTYISQPTMSRNLIEDIMRTFNDVLMYITQKLFDMSLAEVSRFLQSYRFVDKMMEYNLAPCKALLIKFMPMLRLKVNIEEHMRSLLSLVDKASKNSRKHSSNTQSLVDMQSSKNLMCHTHSVNRVSQNCTKSSMDSAKHKQSNFNFPTYFDYGNTFNNLPHANLMTNTKELQQNEMRKLTHFNSGPTVVEPQRNYFIQPIYSLPHVNTQWVPNHRPVANLRAGNYNMQPNNPNIGVDIYNTGQSVSNMSAEHRLQLENNNFRDIKTPKGNPKAQSRKSGSLENSNDRLPLRTGKMPFTDNRFDQLKTNRVISYIPGQADFSRNKQNNADTLEIIPIIPREIGPSQVELPNSIVPRQPLEISSEKSVITNNKDIHEEDVSDQPKDTVEPNTDDVSKTAEIMVSNQADEQTSEENVTNSCSEADVEEFLQTNVIFNKSRASISNQDCDKSNSTENNSMSQNASVENIHASKTDSENTVDESIEEESPNNNSKTTGKIRILSNTVIVKDKSMEITRSNLSQDLPCDDITADKTTQSSEEVVVEKVPTSEISFNIVSISISTNDGIASNQNMLPIQDEIKFNKPDAIFSCIKQSLEHVRNIDLSADTLEDVSVKILSNMPKPKILPPELIKLVPLKRKRKQEPQRKKLRIEPPASSNDIIVIEDDDKDDSVFEDDDKDDSVFEDVQNNSDCNQNSIINERTSVLPEAHSTETSEEAQTSKPASHAEQTNLSCATNCCIPEAHYTQTDKEIEARDPKSRIEQTNLSYATISSVPEALPTEINKEISASDSKSHTELTKLSCTTNSSALETHSTETNKEVGASDANSQIESTNLPCATNSTVSDVHPAETNKEVSASDTKSHTERTNLSCTTKSSIPDVQSAETNKEVSASDTKSSLKRKNSSSGTMKKVQNAIVSDIIEITDSPVKPQHNLQVQRTPVIEQISSDEESDSLPAYRFHGYKNKKEIENLIDNTEVSHLKLIDDNVDIIKKATNHSLKFFEKPLVYTKPVHPQEVKKKSPKEALEDMPSERLFSSNIVHFEEDATSLTCNLKVKRTSELTYTPPRMISFQGSSSICQLPLGRGSPLSPSHLEDINCPRVLLRTSTNQDAPSHFRSPNRFTYLPPVVPSSPLRSGSPDLRGSKADWKHWLAEEHRRSLLDFSGQSIGSNSPSKTLSRRQSVETISSVGSDYSSRFQVEDNYRDLQIDSKVYRVKKNIYEKIPRGKLCYIRESNTFVRYFDDNQIELFLSNLEGSSAVPNILKQIKGPAGNLSISDTSLANSETSGRSEVITLSKNISFSSEDYLSDPELYVEEVEKVERFVPKDFYGFYKFVTGYQIVHYHPPISFQTFLTMHNTNGIRELFKNYINTLIEGQNV